ARERPAGARPFSGQGAGGRGDAALHGGGGRAVPGGGRRVLAGGQRELLRAAAAEHVQQRRRRLLRAGPEGGAVADGGRNPPPRRRVAVGRRRAGRRAAGDHAPPLPARANAAAYRTAVRGAAERAAGARRAGVSDADAVRGRSGCQRWKTGHFGMPFMSVPFFAIPATLSLHGDEPRATLASGSWNNRSWCAVSAASAGACWNTSRPPTCPSLSSIPTAAPTTRGCAGCASLPATAGGAKSSKRPAS